MDIVTRARPWAAWVVAMALVVWAGSPEARQQPATFRTGADAVVLDIVVRDNRGRPIRDLRQDEITVLEDGVARDVKSFRLVEGPAMTATVTGSPPAATAQPDPLRHITLVTLVFDHLSQNGRQLARRAAMDYVKRDLPPGHWVSIFTLDQRLRLSQDFTRERETLTKAVERATVAVGRESVASAPGEAREQSAAPQYGNPGANPATGPPGGSIGADAADQQMRDTIQRMQALAQDIELQQRGHSTLFPLMALAKGLSGLEGRKAILLFSEGFQVPTSAEEAFRSTISEANRANVSFYTIDSRGLDTSRELAAAGAALDKAGRTSQMAMAKRGAGGTSIDEVMNDDLVLSTFRSSTQNVLDELAEGTGGFLIANTNDLRKGLERVTSDLASYYEIAYAPQVGELDGRFRKIEVKVARKGADVTSRSGYFALPPSDTPILPYELPLLAAAGAAAPPRAFDYRVAAFHFHDTPHGRQYTLVAEVPLEHLQIEEDRKTKRYAIRFAVMALVKDASGRIVERLSNTYPLEGPMENVPALKRGNVVFKRQLWLRPGQYTVASVVRDQAADRASVRQISLDVPEASAAIRLSSLSIIRKVDRASDQPDPVEDPFRSGPMRIVPSLDDPISKATTPQISAYVVIYPGAAAGGSPSLTMEFAQDGRTIGRATPELPAPDEQGRIAYVASFPTSGFAPGTYQLKAIARQDTFEDASRTSFTVVP
jgi:VWFA-related protein